MKILDNINDDLLVYTLVFWLSNNKLNTVGYMPLHVSITEGFVCQL